MMIGTALWEVMGDLSETSDGRFQDRPDAFVFQGQAGTAKIDKSNGVITLRDEAHHLRYDSASPLAHDRIQATALEAQLLAEMIELQRSQADRDRQMMIAKLSKRPF